jgi:NAD-dependent deacetylase
LSVEGVHELTANDDIAGLRGWFTAARRIVFLTGAGISTESGIPDFRSASGIYSKNTSTNVFDIDEFYRDPSVYYGFAKEFYGITHRAEPNAAHRAIAALGAAPGKQVTVVTQNIDDLHQRAGSNPVWCVHGNLQWSRCLRCGHRTKTDELAETILRGEIPRHSCGGVYKPEVTFFGELLPEIDFGEAQASVRDAEVLVVVGSSLVVYPAAGLPMLRRRSCRYAIINRDPTDQDQSAHLVIHATAGDILSAAVSTLIRNP